MPFDSQAKPAATRSHQSIRTLFTTSHPFDAERAGFDGPAEPGYDGGFSVTFDGRDIVPSIVIEGSDGQVEITGLSAIKQLCDAIMDAERMARRMSEVHPRAA